MQLISHQVGTRFPTPNGANLPLNIAGMGISSSQVANKIEGLQCSLLLLFCKATHEIYR